MGRQKRKKKGNENEKLETIRGRRRLIMMKMMMKKPPNIKGHLRWSLTTVGFLSFQRDKKEKEMKKKRSDRCEINDRVTVFHFFKRFFFFSL